jgi:hypothetical protein
MIGNHADLTETEVDYLASCIEEFIESTVNRAA